MIYFYYAPKGSKCSLSCLFQRAILLSEKWLPTKFLIRDDEMCLYVLSKYVMHIRKASFAVRVVKPILKLTYF